jgi:hypothetical protein
MPLGAGSHRLSPGTEGERPNAAVKARPKPLDRLVARGPGGVGHRGPLRELPGGPLEQDPAAHRHGRLARVPRQPPAEVERRAERPAGHLVEAVAAPVDDAGAGPARVVVAVGGASERLAGEQVACEHGVEQLAQPITSLGRHAPSLNPTTLVRPDRSCAGAASIMHACW